MQDVFEKIKERLEEEVKYQNEEADLAPPFCELTFDEARRKMAECYEHAIEIVNQAKAEYGDGWIPCSERLPKARQVVLATIFVKSQQRRFVTQIMYSDWWLEGDATMIAWQPMPESYKEEVNQ